MRNQTVTGFQQWKEHLVLVQIQQLKELVQDVRVRQEVRAVVGTVQQEWRLDLLEHCTDLFLYFRGDGRWRIAV